MYLILSLIGHESFTRGKPDIQSIIFLLEMNCFEISICNETSHEEQATGVYIS